MKHPPLKTLIVMFATGLLIGYIICFGIANACIQSLESYSDHAKVCWGGNCKTVYYSDLSTSSHVTQAIELQEQYQNFFKIVVPLSQIPTDWTEKAADPNCGGYYWANALGIHAVSPIDAVDLVTIICEVSLPVWSDEYNRFIYTFTTPSGCP